jgi:hypothetical protein
MEIRCGNRSQWISTHIGFDDLTVNAFGFLDYGCNFLQLTLYIFVLGVVLIEHLFQDLVAMHVYYSMLIRRT